MLVGSVFESYDWLILIVAHPTLEKAKKIANQKNNRGTAKQAGRREEEQEARSLANDR